jgi:hypothetical protein
MTHLCRPVCVALAALLLCLAPAGAQQPPKTNAPPTNANLPFSGLAPAKVVPNLCLLKYRVSTASPEAQALFDQGLGYFYSYVWIEAARSFETAAKLDPDCAMAWWGLSRALEKWSKSNHNQALQKAQEALAKASHREQYLINARLAEKGMLPGVQPTERVARAVGYLDEMLALYEDDEEAWYFRAQLATGQYGKVPFYKALLRINPLHPGANHELLHFYENIQRPALGWIHAEKYIESTPGIPHSFHMQAHLATRLGRWDKTTDRSARAVELHRAYQKEMNVNARQDYQYTHHLQILTISLVHDGRFAEARAIKKEAQSHNFRHDREWFALALGERNWAEAQKIVDQYRRTDKTTASYYAALLALRKGDVAAAKAEVEVLQQAFHTAKNEVMENRLWETQGLLMCMTDGPDAGLKLLAKVVDRTKNNYFHHAWGNGAYYMETWGVAALRANRPEVAEEAFLESLAHDPGSVRGALGLQVLCERQGRSQEASRYAEIARRVWKKADPKDLEAELAWLRGDMETKPVGATTDN